jgi:hypothetical protein
MRALTGRKPPKQQFKRAHRLLGPSASVLALNFALFGVFFEHLQVFCAALLCCVAATHVLFDLYRFGAQVWVISIQPTPSLATFWPRAVE